MTNGTCTGMDSTNDNHDDNVDDGRPDPSFARSFTIQKTSRRLGTIAQSVQPARKANAKTRIEQPKFGSRKVQYKSELREKKDSMNGKRTADEKAEMHFGKCQKKKKIFLSFFVCAEWTKNEQQKSRTLTNSQLHTVSHQATCYVFEEKRIIRTRRYNSNSRQTERNKSVKRFLF